MKVLIPSEFMFHVKELLPPELCQNLIELFQKDGRKSQGIAVSRSGELVINKEAKSCVELQITGDGEWAEAHHKLHTAISEVMAAIALQFPPLQNKPLQWTNYQIQHYAKNHGHFNWHFDAAGPGTFERQMAMVIYLNDVAEGGETSFLFQKLKIKPEAGSAVFFPTFWTHTHCGEKPISGDKFIISSFVSFKTNAQESKKIA